MSRLRVVLVERAGTLGAGLRAFLRNHPDVDLVATACALEPALQGCAARRAAVALVETDGTEDGLAIVGAIATRGGGVPVVVLSDHEDPGAVRRAMRAGALGYLSKDSHHAELIEALRTASAGKRFVCAALAPTIVAAGLDDAAGAAGGAVAAIVGTITDREREVLTRIALGQSNKRSARELGLSVKTVEKHRSNLMRKLDLHNTAAVTMFALRHGLVHEEDAQGR